MPQSYLNTSDYGMRCKSSVIFLRAFASTRLVCYSNSSKSLIRRAISEYQTYFDYALCLSCILYWRRINCKTDR